MEEYKVDHLFLLVGENPLPNYVAARTLLREGGKVYLVFTKHTIGQKKSLANKLKNISIESEPVDLSSYESDAYHIHQKVHNKVKLLTNAKIGLHYTGGTKAMAVHAYLAVHNLKPDAIFSYLDSRRLQMCIDRENDRQITQKISLDLSLKELFNLHNLTWQDRQPPISEPILPEASREFANFFITKDLANSWRDWCRNELYRQTKKSEYSEYWKNEIELSEKPILLSLSGLPDKIKKFLRQHLDASTEQLSLSVAKKDRFESLQQLCGWLDGIWLEDYVLLQIKEKIHKQFKVSESQMSFHIKETERYRQGDKFEFDVGFMLGYQLFAISCTTSANKKLCKQKLFEAYLRTRQLGGDEARVALVCCYDEPEHIRSELRVFIEDPKIEVFGSDDLSKLGDKIAGWIHKNNLEAKQ